jgi:histidinol-phosphate aminotransferase
MEQFRPALKQLKPYVAGKGFIEISRKYGIRAEDIVKLGSNENPYGPSPQVFEALSDVHPERYPEPENLMAGLAAYTGFPEDMIVIGAGMDGVMDTISRIFLDPGDRTFIPTPTFSFYEILTILAGANPIFCPRLDDFSLPKNVPDGIKMAFLCSPNNPTGNSIPTESLQGILESTDAVVFLDEAYVEFAPKSHIDLVKRYDNLIVGRTLSKAFGLAGMRLGYAVLPDWIAKQYNRAAPPFFGISCASVLAGVAALNDLRYMKNSVKRICEERERLQSRIKSHPSLANFLYIETHEPSNEFVEKFQKRGIIIRDCRSFRGSGDHHVRVTVGTRDENDLFLRAYREIIQ